MIPSANVHKNTNITRSFATMLSISGNQTYKERRRVLFQHSTNRYILLIFATVVCLGLGKLTRSIKIPWGKIFMHDLGICWYCIQILTPSREGRCDITCKVQSHRSKICLKNNRNTIDTHESKDFVVFGSSMFDVCWNHCAAAHNIVLYLSVLIESHWIINYLTTCRHLLITWFLTCNRREKCKS